MALRGTTIAASDAHAVTAEGIAANCDAIRDLDGFSVPSTLHDEVRGVAATVAGRDLGSDRQPRLSTST
jgi:hypothetical protein